GAKEHVREDAALERLLVWAAVKQLSDRPADALDGDLRVRVDVPLALECGVCRRNDYPVVVGLCDRPLAGLHLPRKELVEGEPAARFHEVIYDVVVRSCRKRRDAGCGGGRIQELAPGLDQLLHPASEGLIAVELIPLRLVNDVVELQRRA